MNDGIRFAYGMGSDAQIAGLDWIKSQEFLFDAVAKGAPGATREQRQAMMQTLLAERFKLVERERPIIDQTGLLGLYRVKLEWTLARQLDRADAAAGPPLFTAIDEQLGLKLEARKGPAEALIVDSANQAPIEN